MEHNDKLRERVERVISECNDILKALEVQLAKYSPSSFRQAKEIDDTVVRLKRQGLPVPPELTEIRLKLVADSEEYEDLSSLLDYFRGKIADLLANPLFSNRRGSQKRTKKEITQGMSNNCETPHIDFQGFEVTLPPAFIKWGGLSVNHASRKFLPQASEGNQKHLFTINFIGYGQVTAWMSQDRIKIASGQFREVLDRLGLGPYSRLEMKIIQPYTYYEILKVII